MVYLLLLVVLAAAWGLSMSQTGGADFLRVTAFRIGTHILTTLDVLTGLGILALMAATRTPMALTAGLLFILWGLTVFGYEAVLGLALAPLIVFVLILGVIVHLLTIWK